jgi:putative Flp pilus-assembly TadE/G-like protein
MLVSLAQVAGRLRRGEEGSVLVMVAVALPVLILMASFVVDIANWFEHNRHLQMQADAAALAGAREFAIPCANQPITEEAEAYGGETYNAQIGGTDPTNVHMLINSYTYYNQPSETDDTVVTGPPCEARMVDVKLTETDLPWYFKAAQVPFINAHARASLVQVDTLAGALPVGVPDVNPKAVRVSFIDESNGSVLGTTDLNRTPGTVNGLAVWDNATSPVPVTTNARHIGVRVAVGGHTSVTCGEPQVDCFDAGSSDGLLYARGWSAAGDGSQPNEPIARSVTLFNGTCTDPYFSADSSACTIGVRAKVDFGSADPDTVGAGLTAQVDRDDYPLTYDAASDSWQSDTTIPVASGAGPIPIVLKWSETTGTVAGNECKVGGGNKCKGSFGIVQRTFGASKERSGPIKLAQISEDGAFWANSFENCSTCSHNLVVTIGIQGSVQDASSVNDPAVSLRVTGGSQNQSLDCDPDYSNLSDELAYGCRPTYTKNQGTNCPDHTSDLWNSAQPWDCTALQTGTAVNQVPEGLNLRILGDRQPTSCTSPNNWSDFPNLSPDDPRIVQVFLTPYGSFTGSGSENVPVTNFATFYVTGWTAQGDGFANPCQGNGDDPVPNNDAGYIVGHFIKYIDSLDNASGTNPCDLDSFGTCVASLTE